MISIASPIQQIYYRLLRIHTYKQNESVNNEAIDDAKVILKIMMSIRLILYALF